MQLPVRNLPFEVPTYNLTGDIVAFQRCELQYRYYNRSSLPPSRPVQLWTGEFTHGVMEDAFMLWRDTKPSPPFPWPCNQINIPNPTPLPVLLANDVGKIGFDVEERLRATGKEARSTIARDSAYRRVSAAISKLAPHLFPLITAVEEKLSGTRPMPPVVAPPGQSTRGDRYEISGRVDVISSVSLAAHGQNPLVQMIQKHIAGITGDFDVIVDYKAARRPPTSPPPGGKDYWNLEAWQVQTYAWLRAQQPESPPVRAGILIYVNELSPSQADLGKLLSEVQQHITDVIPANGTPDYYALNTYQQQVSAPGFTDNFLLSRAIRVVPVNDSDIRTAVTAIDSVIAQVEARALHENASGNIPANWNPTGDPNSCSACDFRRFCPDPAPHQGQQRKPTSPQAPG